MAQKQLFVLVLLLGIVSRSLSRSCVPCHLQGECGPSPTCSFGVTEGVCSCCLDTCRKGPGEECGGFWASSAGQCSDGQECQGSTYTEAGVCVIKDSLVWTSVTNACIKGNNNLVLDGLSSLAACKLRCQAQTNFQCRSLEYHASSGRCSLSEATSSSSGYRWPCHVNDWIFTEKCS